jgi:localization factor PodJL
VVDTPALPAPQLQTPTQSNDRSSESEPDTAPEPSFTVAPRQQGELEQPLDLGQTPDEIAELSARSVEAVALESISTPFNMAANTAPTNFDPEAMAQKLSNAVPANLEPFDTPITTASIPTRDNGADIALPNDFGTRKLRHAAAAGQADALIEVARRYAEGDNVEKNLKAAAYWYERAAGSGNPIAQYRIGSLYEKGHGVDKDLGLAKLWYQRAAEQGNTKAMHNLAVMHTRAEAGKEPDFITASQWFTRAAELGVTDSQYNLGVLYGRGMGVEQNLIESYKWFSVSAAKGDAYATEKRDEVFQMLSVEDRKTAITLAENWVPQAIIESANLISLDQAYWGISQTEFSAMPEKEKVRRAQSLLGQIGYDAGPADGVSGPRTTEAIKSFKKDMGLGESPDISLQMLEMLQESAKL